MAQMEQLRMIKIYRSGQWISRRKSYVAVLSHAIHDPGLMLCEFLIKLISPLATPMLLRIAADSCCTLFPPPYFNPACRTPVMLRNACSILTHSLTVILAPYFVHAGKCDAGVEDAGFGPWCPAPYVMACLWVLITTLLLNVQVGLLP
jgi:hypothetical protein